MIKSKKYLKVILISVIVSLSYVCLSTIFIHSDRDISYSEANITIPNTIISRGWPFVAYESYTYPESNWIDSTDETVTEQIIWGGLIINFLIIFLTSFVLTILIQKFKSNKFGIITL